MSRIFTTTRLLASALLAILSLSACSSVASLSSCPETPATGAAGQYDLRVGDKVEVDVVDLPAAYKQVSGDFIIQSDGSVAVPIAGRFPAAGSTDSELADKIARALVLPSLFNTPPKVTVELVTPQPYFILGEVTKPGSYPFSPGLSVYSAIATAGDFTYRANKSYALVFRGNQACKASLSVADPSAPTPIYPGDIIRIPEVAF
jgi:protein involved in polysaccharide export with SLBB domain